MKQERPDAKITSVSRLCMKLFNFWMQEAGSKCKYKNQNMDAYLTEWFNVFRLTISKIFKIKKALRFRIFLHAVVLSMPKPKVRRLIKSLYSPHSEEYAFYERQLKLRSKTSLKMMKVLAKENKFFKLVLKNLGKLIREFVPSRNYPTLKEIIIVVDKIQ